ncbi:MAG: hypothetical protein ACI85V_003012 [bacterium]
MLCVDWCGWCGWKSIFHILLSILGVGCCP